MDDKKCIKLIGEEKCINSFKMNMIGDFSQQIELRGALKHLTHFKNGGKVMLIAKKNKVVWQIKPRNLKFIKFIGTKENVEKAIRQLQKFNQEIEKSLLFRDLKIENYKIPIIEKYIDKLKEEYFTSYKKIDSKIEKVEYRFKKTFYNEKLIELSCGKVFEQAGVDCLINFTNKNIQDLSNINKFAGSLFIGHRKQYLSKKGFLEVIFLFFFNFYFLF